MILKTKIINFLNPRDIYDLKSGKLENKILYIGTLTLVGLGCLFIIKIFAILFMWFIVTH
jgi:hypothetical protein